MKYTTRLAPDSVRDTDGLLFLAEFVVGVDDAAIQRILTEQARVA